MASGAGTLQLAKKDWAAASKAFNRVVTLKNLKHDPYARLGLATIQLYTMPTDQKTVSPTLHMRLSRPRSSVSCKGHQRSLSSKRVEGEST